MPDTPTVTTIPHLAGLGNVVPDGYEYREKLATPGEDLSLPNAYLKWYDLRYPDREIAGELVAESRTFLAEEVERLNIKGELGFVILHLCESVALLLLTTWRNTNEMWEAVYVKDLGGAGTYQPLVYENNQRGTYCVWELATVWHERHAWTRFIASQRDEAAKLAYVNDRFTGAI